MVTADEALPGRPVAAFTVPDRHAVLDAPLAPPYGTGIETAYFGMGCFWGAERLFWQTPGVISTAVGYAGGFSPHPTYEEVCSGMTGHAEVVLVAYDPMRVSYGELLKVFFEGHDPTQGMRQGYDTGTQYRSVIYTTSNEQEREAESVRASYDAALRDAGHPQTTTEIAPASVNPFYFAEGYHQQYLHKVPNGYCGLGGCAVSLPVADRAATAS
jgi:peptide-methionine (S)-S-oxide reductase